MGHQIWEVVGGGDKRGILVRAGRALDSEQLPSRLSTGALVSELELAGDRLHFERLTGDGPSTGWVSIKLKDKELLRKTDKVQVVEVSKSHLDIEAAPESTKVKAEVEVATGPSSRSHIVDHTGSATAARAESELQDSSRGEEAAFNASSTAYSEEGQAATPVGLAVGANVEIFCLKSRADLNGKAAKLVSHDDVTGRWECEVLDDGGKKEHIRCKPDNLILLDSAAYDDGDDEPAAKLPTINCHGQDAGPTARGSVKENAGPLIIGARVEIQNLKSRADLNGKTAEVVSRDEGAGRWEVNVESSRENIRCKPENLVVLAALPDCSIKKKGDAAFKAGNWDHAMQFYAKSLEAHPDNVEFRAVLHSNMAAVHAKQGDHASAVEAANEAVSLRPSWAKGYARKALSLLSLGRYEEADSAYAKAIMLEPTTESYLAGLSSAVLKIPQKGPEQAARHKQLGNDALKLGDAKSAIVHYTRALGTGTGTTVDDVATFHSNRSAAFAQLTIWDLALRDGQAAVKAKPSWPKAHVRCGCAWLGMGEHEEAYKCLAHAMTLCPTGYKEAQQNLNAALWRFPLYSSPSSQRRWKRFDEDAEKPADFCRVFAISDVHIDHTEGHKAWAEGLSNKEYKNDVLIVAGDLGDTMNSIRVGLSIFKKKFRRVFYTPGNHDMWVRQDTTDKSIADSVAKLAAIFELCDHLGAEMLPAQIMKNVYVVPLLSWYNYSFDESDPRPSKMEHDKFCKWPMPYHDVWKWFMQLNGHGINKVIEAQHKNSERGDVISFSHFLPRYTLPFPTVMDMVKASGCKEIDKQIRDVKSRVHIFGHSHRNINADIEGIKYIQYSLNDPNYRFRHECPFLLLRDAGRSTAEQHNSY
eukprot:TRINITY_DN59452_c0_g1_i1.p1 TRINITY_DN59452_c0_g1~~TRINITY_DN59452_c0_g1_i1.p1  ORF type:complete len:876 (+),score=154.69 TRINITY_DN59452_c0_g1_i1:26-2629(+)